MGGRTRLPASKGRDVVTSKGVGGVRRSAARLGQLQQRCVRAVIRTDTRGYLECFLHLLTLAISAGVLRPSSVAWLRGNKGRRMYGTPRGIPTPGRGSARRDLAILYGAVCNPLIVARGGDSPCSVRVCRTGEKKEERLNPTEYCVGGAVLTDIYGSMSGV